MKKYKQNQEGLKQLEAESQLLKFLLQHKNHYFHKQELMEISGKSERKVRAELEHIANFYPIRATAGHCGYSLLSFENSDSDDVIRAINHEAFLQACEIENRIESLKARLKPLIAIQKATALKLIKKEEIKKDEQ